MSDTTRFIHDLDKMFENWENQSKTDKKPQIYVDTDSIYISDKETYNLFPLKTIDSIRKPKRPIKSIINVTISFILATLLAYITFKYTMVLG